MTQCSMYKSDAALQVHLDICKKQREEEEKKKIENPAPTYEGNCITCWRSLAGTSHNANNLDECEECAKL